MEVEKQVLHPRWKMGKSTGEWDFSACPSWLAERVEAGREETKIGRHD